MRGIRAFVLLVTAVGLALGLAATTVYDRPVAAPEVEAVCVNTLAVTTQLVATAVADVASADAAPGALAVVLATAALGACFAIVLIGMRLGSLLRGTPDPGGLVAGERMAPSVPRAPTRPLLLSLSIIRI
jgi:hypothetical protein